MNGTKRGICTVSEVHSRLMALKLIRRTGWILRGVTEAESVADHTLGVAMLTFFMGELIRLDGIEIDVEHAVAMAVFHEAGEALIGDITPAMTRYIIDKEAMELMAVRDLVGDVAGGDKVTSLVSEFCETATSEARLVKACDRLEMFLQMRTYEARGNGDLSDFRKDPSKIEGLDLHPALLELATLILKEEERA